jgi:uncharacterized protein YkvS
MVWNSDYSRQNQMRVKVEYTEGLFKIILKKNNNAVIVQMLGNVDKYKEKM